MKNSRLKTAFILATIAQASFDAFIIVLICEYATGHSFLTSNQIAKSLAYLFFVLGPLVLSIVALSFLRRVDDVEREERLFLVLTRVFAWVSIGGVISYIVFGSLFDNLIRLFIY